MTANPLYDGTLSLTIAGHNVTPAVSSLVFGSATGKGDAECTFSLDVTTPFNATADYGSWLVDGAAVVLTHSTGLFSGEIAGDPTDPVVSSNGDIFIEITCEGFMDVCARRTDYGVMLVDNAMDDWKPFTTTIDNAKSFNPEFLTQILESSQ